ncbi:MAG: hypothetical protein AABY18_08440 [Candidatus Thermoplasmatota archaeon]
MRDLVPALVLFTALLAGCAGGGPGGGPEPGPSEGPTGTRLALGFLPPVALPCPQDATAQVYDLTGGCSSFAEPVIEVAGDGTIWASTTCCYNRPPPIWTSRDGGESFELLRDPVRETLGVEGDFAIDAAGNVFFFDMFGGYPGVVLTGYTAAGEHRWTVPFSFKAADRPFVRAGEADQVYAVYSTLDTTVFLASSDGGQTWDPLRLMEVPCRLGILGQGPEPGHLHLVACTRQPRLWESLDGGATWLAPQDIPLPDDDLGNFRYADHDYFAQPPVVDEAGTLYVPFKHPLNGTPPADPIVETGLVTTGEPEDGLGIFLARRTTDGTWLEPVRIGPDGSNWFPWGGAGAAGVFALAWYHTDDKVPTASSTWVLMAAASVDADSEVPTFQVVIADPVPVATGTPTMIFGSPPGENTLGDFLQTDLAPDGRVVIGYARMEGEGTTAYILRSDGALPLPTTDYRNGP